MADYYLHKTAAHIDELLEKVEGLNNYDDTEVRGLINNKVDKETGKGLSTNDFTTEEKTKLAGIESGAQVNVQADWNQTTTTADDYIKNKPAIPDAQIQSDWNQTNTESKDFIKNKPTIPPVYDDTEVRGLINNKVDKETGKGLSTNDFTDAYKTELDGLDTALDGKVNREIGKGLSTNDYTTSEKTKLNGIEAGAKVNVQVDWNQTDTTADDYIKNKPNIPSGVVVDQVYDATSTNAQSGVAIEAKKPGEITTGKQYTIDGQTVTAGDGAEVFNDYTNNKASGLYSHAEGYGTTASGNNSHAEGFFTTASGNNSHAEGFITTASGNNSHAEGYGTTASTNQHVMGKSNVVDSSGTYAFIIGNGTGIEDDARMLHNAFAVDWNGLIYVNGASTGVDVSALAPQSTTYTKDEVDTALSGKQAALTTVQQAAVDSGVTAAKVKEYDELSEIVRGGSVLYGYRVNKNDSNPETRVEYLYDAIGMTPARMNYTTGTFDYGSWGNAWFITGNKPVALKYDGTVDYELDPNDYSKKADGTASDVTDSTYAGNFMASMPTVWIRRWEDDDYEYTAISNKQITSDFYADAHDNGAGDINDMVYLPMFKGCIVDGKMRSLSGVTPTVSTTGSAEKTAAEACGSGWQLWDWSKHELISDLLTLISRSTDSQAAFGNGYISGSAAKTVGTSGAGQFWGANDQTNLVKVFHIEDFWGHRCDRCLGINLVDNQYAYKLVAPYLLEPDSTYTYSGLYAPPEGYRMLQNIGRYGRLPKTVGGSATTFYADYFYKNASGVRLGLCGGGYGGGMRCGSRFLSLYRAASDSIVDVGGSPCFNPIPNE